MKRDSSPSTETLPLSKASEHLLEECRMVLPGIQALFGFQLIAVFNEGFEKKLSRDLQNLHLGAIALTCVAIALIMTPAAYQRQTSPRSVSDDFIRLSSRMLVGSMFPLAASVSLEVYLVALVILRNNWAPAIALACFAMFLSLWFVLPGIRRGGHRRERRATTSGPSP